MDMDGCELCAAPPSLSESLSSSGTVSYGVSTGEPLKLVKPCKGFEVYSALCAAMPGMDQVSHIVHGI
jgi:hypothetical protein